MSYNSSQFPLTPANRQFQFKPWLVEAGIIFIFALATIFINWKMIRDGLNGMTDDSKRSFNDQSKNLLLSSLAFIRK